MGLKAAIYTRVSTEEQRDYGYSIDGQIRELKDYCNRKKYEIVDIYNDAGFSGKNMNRPELERLLKDIKNGYVDVLVAIKVDRITRDGYDGQWLLKECNNYNVALDLLYEQYDTNTSNGEMMFGMNLLFAQRERKEISARTIRGLEEAVKQGKYPATTPYGYVKNEDGTLAIDPVTSLQVKEIFSLYETGISMTKIAEKFEEEKRVHRKNTRWREDKVLKILTNPLYKGECHWRRSTRDHKRNDTLVIPNHSPVIIDEDLFDRCQTQIVKNRHGGYGTHVHIFHHIVKCPCCGKFMSNYFAIKKRNNISKKFYYVICKNKSCSGFSKIYNTEKIEKELIDTLNQLTLEYHKDKYSILVNTNSKTSELETINKAIAKLKKDEQRLVNLYLESSIDVNIINKKNESVKAELRKLELEKAKYEQDNIIDDYNSIDDILKSKMNNNLLGVNNIWNITDRKDRKLILSRYIKSIEINKCDNHKIKIENIVFHTEFIKNGINHITKTCLETIKSNQNLEVKEPILETEFKNNYNISVIDEIKTNSHSFQKLWKDIIKDKSIIYPIYDICNVIKDIKIEIVKV